MRHYAYFQDDDIGEEAVALYKETYSYAWFRIGFAFSDFRDALASMIRSKRDEQFRLFK